jgi:hypothetical protein
MKQLVRLSWLLILLAGFDFSAKAQQSGSAIGEWRVYQPNVNARSVAVTPERVYCATETGFFYYDKEFNNLQVLSKLNGLHDVEISTIKYDSLTATLVVAYKNANLDLIRGEQIINVNDILRKSIVGEKTIYHIYCQDKLAYLSCSFGLVVLDLVKLEIRDSYFFLNADATPRQVFAATALKDKLFLATSAGVMSAVNNRIINLSDQKNWKTDILPQGNSTNIRTIATFNNAVFAGVNNVDVFKFDGSAWAATHAAINLQITQLAPTPYGLLITNEFNLMFLNAANQLSFPPLLLQHPIEAALDHGVFWVADYFKGLVQFDGKNTHNFIPNGPAYLDAFRFLVEEDRLLVLGGGYRPKSQNNSLSGFYEFKNGTWDNFNYQRYNDSTIYPIIHDLSDAVRSPVNGKLYFASYGFGLMEWGGPGDFKIYNNLNSPLGSVYPLSHPNSSKFVRVSDVATDATGNIWVANPFNTTGTAGLHVLRPDNTWFTHTLQNTSEGTSFPYPYAFERILIDDNGYKWLGLKDISGLAVYDDENNRFRYLTNSPTTGNLPGVQVTALAKDLKGEIWVGTESGIGIFFNPEQVFTSNNSIAARIPIINRRALLEGQLVRCITVDGANRKWVGTETGVWLFNADGDEAIMNFTTKNSPLPSDKINDIAINHASGDVFIATEAGLASFRAGATITTKAPDCANVFPNPVRPGFAGQIAISGLSNNGIVKITDITGTLVYETKALGGTALWNGADYNGRRVKPGVYLVMSSSTEGAETCISKVAVIE